MTIDNKEGKEWVQERQELVTKILAEVVLRQNLHSTPIQNDVNWMREQFDLLEEIGNAAQVKLVQKGRKKLNRLTKEQGYED